MKTITYEFADGHIENIEVEDDVAEVFAEIEKYEKKVNRKETRRQVSLNKVCYLLKGLFPALVNGVTEIMIGSKDSARPFFYVNSIGLSDVKRLHLLESFY